MRNFSLGAINKRKLRQTKNDKPDLMQQVTEVMRNINPPKEEVSRGRAVANSIANLLDKMENTDMPLFCEYLGAIHSLELEYETEYYNRRLASTYDNE